MNIKRCGIYPYLTPDENGEISENELDIVQVEIFRKTQNES